MLDLSWNGFGDDGAFAVGEGLKENSSLLELNLRLLLLSILNNCIEFVSAVRLKQLD